ncbi:exopolyphosphatase [Methylobacillus arboreus]|uniref:exopolyphosphatase n=1 Tax=Methylobacillus arboreus TaxID=755170 RepID=UPI001E4E0031|nr:exopolyphosphatase [Methylobacillus arboreus]MCB5190157.1 exopolyphosphatase [Methylobacillus arboreus]
MPTRKSDFPEIAAVDLGSNSFRLQLARVADGHLIFHDSLREVVRLGAGLDAKNNLSADAQQRAIDCLKRFGERLRGLPPQAVRAVATNTFRVARNAPNLMQEAQEALGFPIEVIAGREEARMIFVGVGHSLPPASHKRLVIDIGGGSTEFIIGQDVEPIKMESLYMGCVSYSLRYFPDGKLTESAFARARIAAAAEIQSIRKHFIAEGWDEAVGSSGTAKALGEIIRLSGLSDGEITRDGLEFIHQQLLKAREVKKIDLPGVSGDRAAVLPGGLSIMMAAFDALKIERMTAANSALREGVLYELLGRLHDQDIREVTVSSFMRRYHVEPDQAERVQELALRLLAQCADKLKQCDEETAAQYLTWAARLHEIGVSIAHAAYHKHSAYIIENADMPGFSNMEQETLGLLVKAHRRSLSKLEPGIVDNHDRLLLILILRLAVLFHRNRQPDHYPDPELTITKSGYQLKIAPDWLKENPLTEAELLNEVAYWKEIGLGLELVS